VVPRVKVDCVFPARPRCLDIYPWACFHSWVFESTTHPLQRHPSLTVVHRFSTYISLSDYLGLVNCDLIVYYLVYRSAFTTSTAKTTNPTKAATTTITAKMSIVNSISPFEADEPLSTGDSMILRTQIKCKPTCQQLNQSTNQPPN
jgi:hypothetical protein